MLPITMLIIRPIFQQSGFLGWHTSCPRALACQEMADARAPRCLLNQPSKLDAHPCDDSSTYHAAAISPVHNNELPPRVPRGGAS